MGQAKALAAGTGKTGGSLQGKGSAGGKMFFGGLGKGLAAGAVTRKQDDSKEFAGDEQKQVQGRGMGGIGKGLARGPMRMAGLFGGLFGRGKGRKRFGLFWYFIKRIF